MFSGQVRFMFRYGGIDMIPPSAQPGLPGQVSEPQAQVVLAEVPYQIYPVGTSLLPWLPGSQIFQTKWLGISQISLAGSHKKQTRYQNRALPAVGVGAAEVGVPVPVPVPVQDVLAPVRGAAANHNVRQDIPGMAASQTAI